MDLAHRLVGQAVHEAGLDECDGEDGVTPTEKKSQILKHNQNVRLNNVNLKF